MLCMNQARLFISNLELSLSRRDWAYEDGFWTFLVYPCFLLGQEWCVLWYLHPGSIWHEWRERPVCHLRTVVDSACVRVIIVGYGRVFKHFTDMLFPLQAPSLITFSMSRNIISITISKPNITPESASAVNRPKSLLRKQACWVWEASRLLVWGRSFLKIARRCTLSTKDTSHSKWAQCSLLPYD